MTTPSDPVDTPSPEPSETPFADEPEAPAEVVPPTGAVLLGYRLLGLRLPAEHHGWLLGDAASRTFLLWRSLRTFLWAEVVLWLVLLGRSVTLGSWPAWGEGPREWVRSWPFRFQLIIVAVVLFSSRDVLVRRVLRWHRIDKHGRPVENVKPFARLSNLEAVALGAVVLVLCGAGGAVYGNTQVPRGVRAAPCREADPNVLDRIRAGQTNTKAKYIRTRMVVQGDAAVVMALTETGELVTPTPRPGAPTPTASASPRPEVLAEIWVVRTDGVQRFGDLPKATTGFPTIDARDRKYYDAISRVAECMNKEPVR